MTSSLCSRFAPDVPSGSMFHGTLCVRQRILPKYRVPFFERLAERCTGGFVLIAGQPEESEAISVSGSLSSGRLIRLENRVLLSGVFKSYVQRGLLDALDSISADVFVTEANPRFRDMGSAVRAMRQRGVPVFGWGLGTANFFNHGFSRLRHIRRKRMVNRFDGMLCYSSVAARQYHELGVPEDRVRVCHNSTVERPCGELGTKRSAVGAPILLTIGRLLRNKNFDLLIRAAGVLQRDGLSIQLQIVGDGPDRKRLEDIADQSNATVSFLGEQRGDQLRRIGCEASLFVLPGLGGLAIQEAMSFGLPVIATEADGTEQDLVRSNGWVVEKDNLEALATTIREAVSDPIDLRRRGEESLRIVREEINLTRMVDRFVSAVSEFSGQAVNGMGHVKAAA